MILNQYPLWRYFLLIVVILMGCIYAAPNLYGQDPAIQISAAGGDLQAGDLERMKELLSTSNIAYREAILSEGSVLVRFEDSEIQLQAADTLRKQLGNGYGVALNLAPRTPAWLQIANRLPLINALPMYLGLDLRGGIHFLMKVDMETAVAQRLSADADSIRNFLRENDLRSKTTHSKDSINIRFSDAETRDNALSRLQDEYPELSFSAQQESDSALITGMMREQTMRDERKAALSQNITALRNRVNELGVSEPIIQQQGEDQIIVQLPGVQDSTQAKRIIGATATLQYHLVYGTRADWQSAAQTGRVPPEARLYRQRDGEPVLLYRSIIVSGENVTRATAGFDQNNLPAVVVNLDGKGADRMSKISGDNVGQPMAVVYIETKPGSAKAEEKVISVATIREQLGARFQTTGLTQQEAKDLALLLRAGALKAPMEFEEERTVGSTMGKQSIEQGFNSVVIGLVLVLVFMIIYYRVFGIIANLALIANIVLMVAILSMLQATLTMPGIAGIVLTVGMAVDANVLIFERIREELRNGNSIQASIHAGYEKAFSTIADANITTFIVAIILLIVGTGPVRGFAVTLSIGILTSMFTAILGTRALVNLFYGARSVKKLSI